jgi:peptide chain release factor 1
MKVLRSKLYEAQLREKIDEVASKRKSQVGTGDRSERIRTYNYPQGRVTDHRIGLTLHALENFLNGKIEDMLEALATAERTEMLNNGEF